MTLSKPIRVVWHGMALGWTLKNPQFMRRKKDPAATPIPSRHTWGKYKAMRNQAGNNYAFPRVKTKYNYSTGIWPTETCALPNAVQTNKQTSTRFKQQYMLPWSHMTLSNPGRNQAKRTYWHLHGSDIYKYRWYLYILSQDGSLLTARGSRPWHYPRTEKLHLSCSNGCMYNSLTTPCPCSANCKQGTHQWTTSLDLIQSY